MTLGTNTKEIESAIFDNAYEILTFVGRGRGSIVYKTLKGNETLALKVLVGKAKDPTFNLRRVKGEALAMLSCVHPNVIKLIDYVAAEDLCYLVMEFAERGDLKAIADSRSEAFSVDQVFQFMVQILNGLEAVHRSGIVHRDIKPENLLVDAFGRVKIADFGVAYFPSEHSCLEDTARGVGTFDYLAPESLDEGLCSPATDVYAAAVTCYQLITGALPFAGTTFTEQIANKMNGEISPLNEHLSQVPGRLEDFLYTALSPDPGDRYRSAAEFRKAVMQYLEGDWRLPSKASGTVKLLSLQEEGTSATPSGAESVFPRPAPHVPKLISGLLFITAIVGTLFAAVTYDRIGGNAGAETRVLLEAEREDAATEAVAAVGFAGLLSGPRTGVLRGISADNETVPMLLTPTARGELVLGLGIAGWEPLVLNEQALRSDRLLLEGGGLTLELTLVASSAKDYALEGRYIEHTTGREGEWYVR